MKKIEAIIRPFKLDEVYNALMDAGFTGLNVTEIKGYGRQKGHKEVYRSSEYNVEFIPKLKIDLICDDAQLDMALQTIIKYAKTGEFGDGKIFVLNVEQIIRIRTEESGISAI